MSDIYSEEIEETVQKQGVQGLAKSLLKNGGNSKH